MGEPPSFSGGSQVSVHEDLVRSFTLTLIGGPGGSEMSIYIIISNVYPNFHSLKYSFQLTYPKINKLFTITQFIHS